MNSFSLPAFLGRFPNAVLGALLGPACAHSSAPSPAMASLSSSSPTGTTICCLLCTKPSLVQVFLLDYSLYMQFTVSLLVPPAEFPSSHLPVTAASVFSGLSCTLPNQSAKTNVMLAFLIHPLTVTFFPSSLGKKKKRLLNFIVWLSVAAAPAYAPHDPARRFGLYPVLPVLFRKSPVYASCKVNFSILNFSVIFARNLTASR